MLKGEFDFRELLGDPERRSLSVFGLKPVNFLEFGERPLSFEGLVFPFDANYFLGEDIGFLQIIKFNRTTILRLK